MMICEANLFLASFYILWPYKRTLEGLELLSNTVFETLNTEHHFPGADNADHLFSRAVCEVFFAKLCWTFLLICNLQFLDFIVM